MSDDGLRTSIVRTLLLLALGAAMTTASATAGLQVSASPNDETTAVVRRTGNYITLDWQTRATTTIYSYAFPLYDRLVAYDLNNRLVPYLATGWKLTPRARPKSIVFTLRRGVKCADGHLLTPVDVAKSFQRFIDVPKVSNQLPRLFGNGPYHLSANLKKWTFTFRSETPSATMLNGFAASGIICPAGLEALKSDPAALEKNAYGSGPYTLGSATSGVEVVYKKNPAWKWGPSGTDINNLPDTLVYKIVTDETTTANLIITGAVDFGTVNGPDVSRLAADKSIIHKQAQNYHFFPLVFNQQPGHITTSDKVRSALMTAVNTKDFAQAAWQGMATVTPSILHPSEPCYDKDIAKYAPTGGAPRARQILQSDGYQPNGSGIMTKNGQTLKVTVLSTPQVLGGGGEYLAAQFKAAGFDVDLVDVSTAIFSPRLTQGQWDVTISTTFVFAPIQGANMAVWTGPPPPTGTNFGYVGGGDNEYNRAALIALQRTDCTWFVKLQRLILQKHVMLPLAQPIIHSFGNKKWLFPANLETPEIEFLKPTR